MILTGSVFFLAEIDGHSNSIPLFPPLFLKRLGFFELRFENPNVYEHKRALIFCKIDALCSVFGTKKGEKCQKQSQKGAKEKKFALFVG